MARIDAVLLDRDGTIIVDGDYLSEPAGVELLPGAAQALRELSRAGRKLFIVTNQSGIGRGYFSREDYSACHAALENILRESSVFLSGSAFCPHAPSEDCDCRKPRLGMWEKLAREYSLRENHCAMVGDKAEDALFGRLAGFSAVVLVLTGKGKEAAKQLCLPLPDGGELFQEIPQAYTPAGKTLPHAVAHDLTGAARYLLAL